MIFATEKWMKRIDFFFLSVWLMTSFGAALISLLWFGVDFRGYYAAARVLLAGGNPYDYRQVAAVLLQVTGEMGNNPYYYPPWFAWLFIPFAALPFQIARAIWMLFNLIVWNAALFQAGTLVNYPPQGWKRSLIFLTATITFAWVTFRYEQAGILTLGILVAMTLAAQNQKWTQAGLWLALLLIKPNITLIIVAGVSLWLLRNKQRRPVAVMIFTVAILLIISTMITPDWFAPLFTPGFGLGLTSTLDGPDVVGDTRINTTLLDWLKFLGVQPDISATLYRLFIPITGVAFILTIVHAQSILEVVSLTTLISCAVTPYALQYDYPPLVITFLWALSLPKPGTAAAWIKSALTGFILYASMWAPSIASRYWIIIGMVALLAYALYSRNSVPAKI